VLPVWQSLRWPLLILLAGAALVLGHLGFRKHSHLVGELASLSATRYLWLQPITLESGSLAPPAPGTLDVARCLAPLTGSYPAGVALGAVFREQVGFLRLRFYRDRVAVGGLGRKGTLLALALREAGCQVVAIERHQANEGMAEYRAAGVIVLEGEATDAASCAKPGCIGPPIWSPRMGTTALKARSR